jgi:hypothetical protein
MEWENFLLGVEMTAKKAETADPTEIPTQSEEARRRALEGANPAARTATGQALENLSGAEDERIENLDNHGSDRPIAGGDALSPDYSPFTAAEPVGLQAQPAAFAGNGSLDPAMVASPTGLIPVSAVASDHKEAANRIQGHFDAVEAQLTGGALKVDDLTDEQIDRLDGATLRAVAAQEGLDIGENGTRTARKRFKAAIADRRSETDESSKKSSKKSSKNKEIASAAEQTDPSVT